MQSVTAAGATRAVHSHCLRYCVMPFLPPSPRSQPNSTAHPSQLPASDDFKEGVVISDRSGHQPCDEVLSTSDLEDGWGPGQTPAASNARNNTSRCYPRGEPPPPHGSGAERALKIRVAEGLVSEVHAVVFQYRNGSSTFCGRVP